MDGDRSDAAGRFNIIGESVTLWGTVRALEQADMAIAQQNLRRLAEHHALAYGVTATVHYLQDVPPVMNTADWLDAILPTVRGVLGGRPCGADTANPQL